MSTTEVATKTEKKAKDLRQIDFLEVLANHPVVQNTMEGAEVDEENRSAETADIVAFVDVCKTQEAPFDQEFLNFTAKTTRGVELLCAQEHCRRNVRGEENPRIETPEEAHVGLFNYALGLRFRTTVSSQMKKAAEGPEKQINKAIASLRAVFDSLPDGPQKEAMRALIAASQAQ